jgi:hypothetical protein
MMAFGVAEGTKVLDPRGDRAIVSGLGERPRRIAEAVLTVIAGGSSATEQPGIIVISDSLMRAANVLRTHPHGRLIYAIGGMWTLPAVSIYRK